MDLRGFKLSDKTKVVENYSMKLLVSDVAAVIKDATGSSATVIRHDSWGVMISCSVAMYAPRLVDKLIILNLPHPRGLNRELVHNPGQQKNNQYARTSATGRRQQVNR